MSRKDGQPQTQEDLDRAIQEKITQGIAEGLQRGKQQWLRDYDPQITLATLTKALKEADKEKAGGGVVAEPDPFDGTTTTYR